MKTSALLILFTSLFFSCAGQQQHNPVVKITERLIKHYNAYNADSLYMQLSGNYKKSFSKDQMDLFFQKNLKPYYGNIKTVNYTGSGKNGEEKFLVIMEKGNLDLDLYTANNGLIDGMLWAPHQETSVTKRDVSTVKSSNPKATPLQKAIDRAALQYFQTNDACGLSIGIINKGRAEKYYYGETKKGNQSLPNGSTIYEIGSVTKTFTGIALAHAVNGAKIKLSEDIRKYLGPGFSNLEFQGTPIQVQHLSNHTSGLPRMPENFAEQPNYNPENPYKNYSRAMMLSYLSKVKLSGKPGEKMDYSNFAAALLGLILENVYKRPLEEIYSVSVSSALKLKHTKLLLLPKETALYVSGYSKEKEVSHWELSGMAAAGGLKSNLDDMLLYLQASMDEKNIDFALSHKVTYKGKEGMAGLNWFITETGNGSTLVWHNGATGGFTSYCGYVQGKDAGAVILSNSSLNSDLLANQILKEVLTAVWQK